MYNFYGSRKITEIINMQIWFRKWRKLSWNI